ncbi:Spo0E family sporulation regulatory protein-aspartic acid phosphatase [Clostridium sp. YIM B02500]|uniref:Spo0E family sporulation regulatory protein-aspartic acid phosphatase n=1 Tax=Clostridium sp. YIM B02500 TaxID=2910681 RepID=UPI001EEDD3F0|nr:Spo0E family sporulation regulatory protein-aspartic acid phosphatase [Clostridium sp. YIM B02500]
MEYLKEKEMMISRMRQALCKIMGDEENLLDWEVISACRRLNFALNEYNELLRRTIK